MAKYKMIPQILIKMEQVLSLGQVNTKIKE